MTSRLKEWIYISQQCEKKKDLVTLWNKYTFTVTKTMRSQILKCDLISYNCDCKQIVKCKKICIQSRKSDI